MPLDINGRIGRITLKPLEVEFPNISVTARHRSAKLKLTCAGGQAETICDGRVLFTSPGRRDAQGQRHSRRTREIVLARGRFMVPSESTRWVSIRLTPEALDMLDHRSWLRVEAGVTVKGGEETSSKLFLQR